MVVSIGWWTKSLHRKWLEITKHLFINGCLGFQVLTTYKSWDDPPSTTTHFPLLSLTLFASWDSPQHRGGSRKRVVRETFFSVTTQLLEMGTVQMLMNLDLKESKKSTNLAKQWQSEMCLALQGADGRVWWEMWPGLFSSGRCPFDGSHSKKSLARAKNTRLLNPPQIIVGWSPRKIHQSSWHSAGKPWNVRRMPN